LFVLVLVFCVHLLGCCDFVIAVNATELNC